MLMDKNSDMYRDYSVKFKNNIKRNSKNNFFTEHFQTTASENKSFFSEKQMGIQFKNFSSDHKVC